ncbi:hypothetical protein D3C80_898490 [compost metagenome]
MAAAEDEGAGAIEDVEHGDAVGAGRQGGEGQASQQQAEDRQRGQADRPRNGKGQTSRGGRGRRAAKAEPRQGADQDGRDLARRAAQQHQDQYGGRGDGRPLPVWRQGAGHRPHRLRHDGHRRQLQPVDKARPDRPLEMGRAEGEHDQKHGGRQGKGAPRRQAAQRTGAQQAQGVPHLAGGRPGQELAHGD